MMHWHNTEILRDEGVARIGLVMAKYERNSRGDITKDGKAMTDTEIIGELSEGNMNHLLGLRDTGMRVCKSCNATNPFVGGKCPACHGTDLYLVMG